MKLCVQFKEALGEENQKVFAKASIALGKTWGKSILPAQTPEALMVEIANYFQNDLKLSKNVTLEKQEQNYILKFRGATLITGNS